jgi:hypothetical protein
MKLRSVISCIQAGAKVSFFRGYYGDDLIEVSFRWLPMRARAKLTHRELTLVKDALKIEAVRRRGQVVKQAGFWPRQKASTAFVAR